MDRATDLVASEEWSYGLLAGALASPCPALPLTALGQEVFDRFEAEPALSAIAVVDASDAVVGLVRRTEFLLRYADRFGRALFERRPVHFVMQPRPFCVDADEAVDVIGEALCLSGDRGLLDGFPVTTGGRYLGMIDGFGLLRAMRNAQAAAADRIRGFNAVLDARVRERTADAEAARIRAEEASLVKSRFIATMSHELRTPLNAIIGFTELVSETLDPTEHAQSHADLARVLAASHHLLDLINAVLDLSKIEAGRMDLTVRPVEVVAFAETIAAEVAPLMARNRNRFGICVEGAPGLMHTDRTKLRQCLLNLLSNAAKFSRDGVVTLTVRAVERAGQSAVAFTVADTGIGISQEQASRLFQPFAQAETNTASVYGGTGLGLSITRRLAELMGGEIALESAPGAGSSFTLSLPVDWEAEAVRRAA